MTTPEQYSKQEMGLKKLEAPIARARKSREEKPDTHRECEQFERMLLLARSGYSSVSSELVEIAKKCGVRLEGVSFKRTPIHERRLTEVAMESTIEGDYKNVILFLNGLQRAANIYGVESLTLAAQKDNKGPSIAIKVGLHCKT